jgi:hypothetical protein
MLCIALRIDARETDTPGDHVGVLVMVPSATASVLGSYSGIISTLDFAPSVYTLMV